MDEDQRDRRRKRSYPVLEALFPPRPQVAPADPRRRPGAPLPYPAAPPRRAAAPRASQGPARPAELIDFMVYGTDDEGTPEVHLAFREEVLEGIYLKLRFETAGVRAIFMVRDAAGRRAARAYGPDILARLEQKGMRTTTVEIEEQRD